MARLYTNGAEMQSLGTGVEFSQAAVGGAAVTIDTTTKHSGAASYKFVSSDAASRYLGHLYSTSNVVTYARAYVYFTSFPTDSRGAILQVNDTADTVTQGTISIETNGTLKLWDGNIVGNARGSASAALSLNTWYMIEIKVESGATNELEARLNGAVFAQGAMTPTNNGGMLYWGCIDWMADCVMYMDDIAVNDNNGTTYGSRNTGYPGEEMLVMALPVGAGASAATTGTYDMINEIPPSDTATSGETMVELDVATTTALYAMTSPTTLGIPSGARINFVEPLVRIREETSGSTNYYLLVKATDGLETVSGVADCGDTTVRTNPSGTTSFGLRLYAYTSSYGDGLERDWNVTGDLSLETMQVGVRTSDGAPDDWVLWLGAYISYIPAKIDQTEAAFYENGTESGSTVISSGADSITRDVTTNSNIQLRVRLQEQNVSGTDSADDWQLQYSKNGGVYTNVGGSEVIGYNSGSLTDGNATTNRLGNGTVLSFVGQAAAQAASVTMPTHQAGDLIIGFAFRDGSTISPSDPIFYSTYYTQAGTSSSCIVSYKIANSSNELSGSWANASSLIIQVYRGQLGSISPLTNNAASYGTGTSVSYPALSAITGSGTSWGLRFSGHSSVDTSLETAPSGYTNRSNDAGANCETAGFDTNGTISSSSVAAVEVGGTSGNWITRTIELQSSIFTAGKISEDGLIDNHSLPSGSWTEHLYSLTLVASALSDADTLDFRVLRNGVALEAYTVTPRITVSKSAISTTGNFFLAL